MTNVVLGGLLAACVVAGGLFLVQSRDTMTELATEWEAIEDYEDSGRIRTVLIFAENGRFEQRRSGETAQGICRGTWERDGDRIEATCDFEFVSDFIEIEPELRILRYTLESESRLATGEDLDYTPVK